VSDSQPLGIFLSYRRADAAPYARSLQQLFSQRANPAVAGRKSKPDVT
jgi:hypothetical protein